MHFDLVVNNATYPCFFPQEEMFVDVGVYGVPKNERFDAERTTRKVEEFVR